MNEHLYRSVDDRIIAGVAGGLAERFAIDPSLVRIGWVLLLIPTAGFAIVLYIVMAFVVPEDPADEWADQGRPDPATTSAPSDPGAAAASAAFADSGQAAQTAGMPNTAPYSSAPLDPAAAASFARVQAAGARASARAAARQGRREARAERRAHSDPLGVLMFGLILILVGGYFLVRAYLPAIDVEQAWPVLLIVIGIALLLGSVRRSNGSNASPT